MMSKYSSVGLQRLFFKIQSNCWEGEKVKYQVSTNQDQKLGWYSTSNLSNWFVSWKMLPSMTENDLQFSL